MGNSFYADVISDHVGLEEKHMSIRKGQRKLLFQTPWFLGLHTCLDQGFLSKMLKRAGLLLSCKFRVNTWQAGCQEVLSAGTPAGIYALLLFSASTNSPLAEMCVRIV